MSDQQKTLDDIGLDSLGDTIVQSLSGLLGRGVGIYLAVVDSAQRQVQSTTNMEDPAGFIAFLHEQADTAVVADVDLDKPTVN